MALNDFCNILDTSFIIAHSAGDPPKGKWKESHLYSVWRDMKIRCYNKNSPNYKNYGGRGIAMDPKWKDDYPAFYKWAKSHGYREGLQLDRINTNKNYTPKNCRFVTQSENLSNRRPYTIPQDHIAHYGVSKLQGAKIGSGRYPLGSGEEPYQHNTREKGISKTNTGTQQGPNARVRSGLTETAYNSDVNDINADGGVREYSIDMYHNTIDGEEIDKTYRNYQSALASYNDFCHKEVTKTEFTDEDGDTVTRWVNPATLVAADDSYLRNAPDSDSSGHSHQNGQVTDDDMDACNPGGNTTSNRDNNCIKCTADLELRMRGYDLSAGRAYGGGLYNCQNFWFDGAKTEGCQTPEEAKDLIASYGNNTSGELHIEWGKNTGTRGGGAHSIHWTVDSDGQFEIQDGQTGERYGSIDEYMEKHSNAWDNMNVTRLDNCEPNWEAIGNDSVVRSNPNTTDPADCKVLNAGKFTERSSGYASAEVAVANKRERVVNEFNKKLDDGDYSDADLDLSNYGRYASREIEDAFRTLKTHGVSDSDKEAAKKFLKDTVAKDSTNTLLGKVHNDYSFGYEPEDLYAEAPNINDYLSDDY